MDRGGWSVRDRGGLGGAEGVGVAEGEEKAAVLALESGTKEKRN